MKLDETMFLWIHRLVEAHIGFIDGSKLEASPKKKPFGIASYEAAHKAAHEATLSTAKL